MPSNSMRSLELRHKYKRSTAYLRYARTTAAALGMPGARDVEVYQAHLHDVPNTIMAMEIYRDLFALPNDSAITISVHDDDMVIDMVIDMDTTGPTIVRTPGNWRNLSTVMVVHRRHAAGGREIGVAA